MSASPTGSRRPSPSSRRAAERTGSRRGSSAGAPPWLKWAIAAVVVVGLVVAVRWWTHRGPSVPDVPVAAEAGAPVVRAEIVASMPHDTSGFTQGLYVETTEPLTFIEGTGLEGRSELRRVDAASGRILKRQKIADTDFGEGLALLDGRIYQITWQQQHAYVYDAATWAPLDTLRYTGEGWGLTTDGTSLVMSNGSPDLVWRNPATFAETRRVRVMDGANAVGNLNELEWIDGEVWANIWGTDVIAVIDPASGKVRRFIDLAVLRPIQGNPRADVLNGIAYDPATKRLFVTGKLWGSLYEIRVPPAAAAPSASSPAAPAR